MSGPVAVNTPPSWLSALDWLGRRYPFTNGDTTDLEINGADQTLAPTNGVIRRRSITFTTAHVLRITSTPCIICVDTLTWNAAGSIRCEASGTPALGEPSETPFPRGGYARDSGPNGQAVGGYGGGVLIVLAGVVNGSTTGTIRASGTAANRNTTAALAAAVAGGEGALSARMSFVSNTARSLTTPEAWLGMSAAVGTNPSASPASPATLLLGNGGDSTGARGTSGAGGGSGGVNSTDEAGGGSGFGGGGAARDGAAAGAGGTPLVPSSIAHVLALYALGCRGGGGGGAIISTTGANNCAGGGGGGLVVLIVDTESQVSTLTAGGGAAVGNGGAGAAGATIRQVV